MSQTQKQQKSSQVPRAPSTSTSISHIIADNETQQTNPVVPSAVSSDQPSSSPPAAQPQPADDTSLEVSTTSMPYLLVLYYNIT